MTIKNINPTYIFVLTFMIALIIIFSIIAINLKPLKTWAEYQNICIKEESVDKTIPWAVRKCNGRSKVYQVK
tara:strand:- start:8302 stop:8517 length:216 start_codon:yes stop_codon:yes gene_type:complete